MYRQSLYYSWIFLKDPNKTDCVPLKTKRETNIESCYNTTFTTDAYMSAFSPLVLQYLFYLRLDWPLIICLPYCMQKKVTHRRIYGVAMVWWFFMTIMTVSRNVWSRGWSSLLMPCRQSHHNLTSLPGCYYCGDENKSLACDLRTSTDDCSAEQRQKTYR